MGLVEGYNQRRTVIIVLVVCENELPFYYNIILLSFICNSMYVTCVFYFTTVFIGPRVC